MLTEGGGDACWSIFHCGNVTGTSPSSPPCLPTLKKPSTVAQAGVPWVAVHRCALTVATSETKGRGESSVGRW